MLEFFISNSNFYETINVISMSKHYSIEAGNHQKLVEGTLEIMRKNYKEGISILL